MIKFGTRRFLTLLGAGAFAAAGALPAGATATNTVALWQMSEPAGATVLQDASGHGVTGSIGSAVVTGKTEAGVGYFHWVYAAPNKPPAKPERLVEITDNRLDPGTGDYAITVRYRTKNAFGNIVQKGQATTPGGQVKVELPKGQITCLYRGANGRRAIKSVHAYNDNAWHTFRCERTASAVTLKVYDASGNLQETRTIKGATGNLANSYPMTIGGKSNCDQVKVTCDYFTGDIDSVQVENG